jgi:hypothetical protein
MRQPLLIYALQSMAVKDFNHTATQAVLIITILACTLIRYARIDEDVPQGR